jgi:hypothetical protein
VQRKFRFNGFASDGSQFGNYETSFSRLMQHVARRRHARWDELSPSGVQMVDHTFAMGRGILLGKQSRGRVAS